MYTFNKINTYESVITFLILALYAKKLKSSRQLKTDKVGELYFGSILFALGDLQNVQCDTRVLPANVKMSYLHYVR